MRHFYQKISQSHLALMDICDETIFKLGDKEYRVKNTNKLQEKS